MKLQLFRGLGVLTEHRDPERSKRRKRPASGPSFGQDRERGARSLALHLAESYRKTIGGVKTEIPANIVVGRFVLGLRPHALEPQVRAWWNPGRLQSARLPARLRRVSGVRSEAHHRSLKPPNDNLTHNAIKARWPLAQVRSIPHARLGRIIPRTVVQAEGRRRGGRKVASGHFWVEQQRIVGERHEQG